MDDLKEHLDLKVKKYLDMTNWALDKVEIAAPERSHNRKIAEDFVQMATCYRDDAVRFIDEGDLVNALSCLNYAYGWLDAGARVGLFDVGGDDQGFTLAE